MLKKIFVDAFECKMVFFLFFLNTKFLTSQKCNSAQLHPCLFVVCLAAHDESGNKSCSDLSDSDKLWGVTSI